jgi:hypothetical protein
VIHDATKDGEELRKKDETLKLIQAFVKVGVHRLVQGEEPVEITYDVQFDVKRN